MQLGLITPLAWRGMKRHGITLDGLRHLLDHGRVERGSDGARLISLVCPRPGHASPSRPPRTLYAVLDAAGEVLTVAQRVRHDG